MLSNVSLLLRCVTSRMRKTHFHNFNRRKWYRHTCQRLVYTNKFINWQLPKIGDKNLNDLRKWPKWTCCSSRVPSNVCVYSKRMPKRSLEKTIESKRRTVSDFSTSSNFFRSTTHDYCAISMWLFHESFARKKEIGTNLAILDNSMINRCHPIAAN